MSSAAPSRPKNKLAVKSAETRGKLIAATLRLLAKHEFHRSSIDAIAAEAGVTKGAIYFHFESKDALLMAAFLSRPDAKMETMLQWPARRLGTVRQRLRRLGEAVLAQRQATNASVAAGAAEFLLYAMTNDALRAQIGQMLLRSEKPMNENILALFDPDELPMPVESFGTLLGTLIPGLMFTDAFRTTPLKDEVILDMFEGLAGR